MMYFYYFHIFILFIFLLYMLLYLPNWLSRWKSNMLNNLYILGSTYCYFAGYLLSILLVGNRCVQCYNLLLKNCVEFNILYRCIMLWKTFLSARWLGFYILLLSKIFEVIFKSVSLQLIIWLTWYNLIVAFCFCLWVAYTFTMLEVINSIITVYIF